jgi:hypothetical protein
VPQTADEAVAAIRDQHGRGATRYVTGARGVGPRQAQRYLAGRGLSGRTAANRMRREALVRAAGGPARAKVEDAATRLGRVQRQVMARAPRARVAARILRKARLVDVGRARVASRSSGREDGFRRVGMHQVGGDLYEEELVDVAELLDEEDWDEADEAFSDAMLDAYARSRGDSAGAASGPLIIVDYPAGIRVQ